MYPPKGTDYPPQEAWKQPATGIPVGSGGQLNPATGPGAYQTPPPAPWSTGLFGCFEDISNCFITCCCPCITFGQIAEIVDRGSTSCGASGALYTLILCVTGCTCIYSCFYRSKMRGQYSLQDSPCPDFLIHCCCESCALCQEYRELKHQGFDMTIGWQANMERKAQGQQVPPATQGGMSR